ncbi:MAG: hypothetical protein AAF569_02710 [Pseudomonadota bacterium]
MKTVLAFAVLFLVGCTTTADIQNQCAAISGSFTDEVTCLDNMVATQAHLSGDSFVKEYILTGRLLVDRLNAGDISENEARLQFARAYNQMRLQQQRLSTLSAVEFEALSPRYQDCDIIDGDRIRCRSY